MDFSLDSTISFDWFILLLRIVFIALIYFFLYQVARVSIRELVTVGTVAQSSQSANLPSPSSALEVIDPAESSLQPGDLLPLEHYTTIGRRDDNSMMLDDFFVSGAHAEIVFDQGTWWVMDLGSTNGTFVNRAPVRARTRINQGDIVQFGRIALRANI
jgi:pSer/pThr/pTyr-binding forkhead associated (FHA) protein